MTCSKNTRPDTGLSSIWVGELGLQDRDVVAAARGPIGQAERVRQDRQPLAQQRVDLPGSKPIAEGLQSRRILDRREPVVERGVMRCRPWRPAFGPLVAVDTLLGVVREVGAELHKERAEIIIDG